LVQVNDYSVVLLDAGTGRSSLAACERST
jgi:hypothetical protein